MRGRSPRRLALWRSLGFLVVLLPLLRPDLLLRHSSPSWMSLFSEWEAPSAQHSVLMASLAESNMNSSRSGESALLWHPPDNDGWAPCLRQSVGSISSSNFYLQVFLEGGLNQQRMGVCDAVAVAKILNATLVVPHLDVNPVWQDSSSFADIYDVDYFIDYLAADVKIVKGLPSEFYWSTREYYATGFRATRVKDAPVHARPSWYVANVLPILQSYGVAAIAPFSHRLAFDEVPPEIQKLRCKVNFHALRFVKAITSVGDVIVSRLRQAQNDSPPSKFVALHLRFDKDMAAHSACDFGGGRVEQLALAYYRHKVWQGRVPNSRLTVQQLRLLGKCPLTPEEAGLTLAALGFGPHTRVYLASHQIYGGEARLSFLKNIFPLMQDKASLAIDAELRPFERKASLSAALDYYVCLKSDFFLSASPGNMHNAVIGHRTYQNVQKTLRPDMVLLSRLFSNSSMEWPEFQNRVYNGHRNRLGQVRLRQPKQSIYTYPAPDCMCKSNIRHRIR
ncbi:O-fucosyltransferase 31 isoform X2 [Selaginella moellendorffii]|uniref:O-fucosyltransferase 31 isoform X2 n=1 Tax=Selaginella moellendorffii TaxID=88036 RepID=UPI000D1C4AAA|nr:O-fucosyltransferase 31 isoform X2 [Selaginella moellendorffii]|eukprot:XP_024527971.1 O-fucosyltransferase 31 isoform X2 [Selaginella moellendorffii]